MIKIDRPQPPGNTILDKRRQEALQAVKSDIANKNFSSKSFNSNLWRNKKVKVFLRKSQHGKCCYCDRKRDEIESDVEHFRPKTEVSDCKEHPGYWWLAYNWDNLMISCKVCNSQKKSHFPLADESRRAFSENDNIDEEKPLLINPLQENPEEFVEYDIEESSIMVKAVGKCERGKRTVDGLTGINKKEVMEERMEKLSNIKTTIALLKIQGNRDVLERYLSPETEFAGLARFYLKSQGIF